MTLCRNDFKSFRQKRLIQFFFYLLFVLVAVFITAGVFVQTDGRLDRIVAQQHLRVPVQVVKASGPGPEQPSPSREALNKDRTQQTNAASFQTLKLWLTSRDAQRLGFLAALPMTGLHEKNEPEGLMSERSR